ncbi:MAG: HAD family hydrolase [Bellilinea sp.]
MIELSVPGRGTIALNHLVCDVNGTIAFDGNLMDGVARSMRILRDRLEVHLVTADTHGSQSQIDFQLGLKAQILQRGDEARQKAVFVESLGADHVVAIGQGANDSQMLRAAALGICVLSREGTSAEALQAADIFVPDILSALELLEKPLRLIATLRK